MIRSGSSLLAPIGKRLEGKVALITGGASGIGEYTAKLFAKQGAKVVIADIQDELGNSVCEEIGNKEAVSYVHCNVTKDNDMENAVNTAVSKHGKLDIFFGNAGIVGKIDVNISSFDYENYKRVYDTNVYGSFLGAKHASRVMIPAKKGSIIFTSSFVAVTAGYSPYTYSTSKCAVIGLAKNLCVELGQVGIRVNCISPFVAPTPLALHVYGGIDRKNVMGIVAASANLKEVEPEVQDIAEAALYLGSDESKYVSGQNLVVDGGYGITNTSIGNLLKDLK